MDPIPEEISAQRRRRQAWLMLAGLLVAIVAMVGAIATRRHLESPTEQTLRQVFRQVRDDARRESSPFSLRQLWLIGNVVRSVFGSGNSNPFEIQDEEKVVDNLGPEATPLLAKALRRNRSSDVRIFCAKRLANRIGTPEVLPAMIAALHAERQDSVRLAILQAMAQKQEEAVLLELLAAVKTDPAADVRAAAAEGLAEWTDKRVFAVLAATFPGESNGKARQAMVAALGQQDDPRVATLLLTLLATDSDDSVRATAAGALPRWDVAGVPEALAKALRDDQSSDVRASAVRGLPQYDPEFSIPKMIAALTDDASADVREAAAETLGESGDTRAVAPLLDKLKDSEEDVAMSAAAALGKLGNPDAISPLIEILSTNNSASVLRQVAEALGKLGDSRAVPPLLAFLQQVDSRTENEWEWKRGRNQALTALAMIGGTEAVETLAMALSATKTESSELVEISNDLAMMGTPAAIDALLKATTSPNEEIRLAAATGLSTAGREEGVTILMQAIGTGSPPGTIKGEYIASLGNAMDPRTIPMLIKSREGFTKEASWALGHFEDSRAVAALLETLRCKSEDILCLAGGFALAEIADPATADELTALLATKHDEYSQLSIACALAFIDRQEALPVLSHHALVKSDWQRLAAAMGLIRLGTPEAIEALRPLLRDSNPPLRELARRALAGEGTVALASLLSSPNSSFADYAARCLVFLHDPATRPMLEAAMKASPNAEVRRFAALAVRRIQRDAERKAEQKDPASDLAATAEP